jgi:cytochrome c oxidase cbb3-type subunit 2
MRQLLTRLWRHRHGVAAIAATYVFFLIFAQYGFLRLMEANLEDGVAIGMQARALRPIMATMGIAGLVASLLTPLLLKRTDSMSTLATAFMACVFTSVVAQVAHDNIDFFLVAALIGLSLGTLTVTLASDLRRLLPGGGYGLAVGAGTGIAYWICNLPPIFEGSPQFQTLVAGVACLLGFFAILTGRPGEASDAAVATEVLAPALRPRDCRGLGFATIILAFLALIWVDSAAFNIVQETLALKSETWGSAPQKLLMGASHLLAALLAGFLIDRGRFRSLLVGAFGLFVVSFTVLSKLTAWALITGPIYAAGISLYSVALVAYPSFVGDRHDLVPRRFRAAAVYGIGGWLGSALGVGMAMDLHRIPAWFLVAAGALIIGPVLLPLLSNRDLTEVRRAFGSSVLFATAAGLVVLLVNLSGLDSNSVGAQTKGPEAALEEELGRAVYISEGCINCHSQYVRPEGQDLLWWGPTESGPHSAVDATPPLLGNRRQGPDLTNVGNRRSTLWQELHLRSPRSVSPGSRMPSYAHLFDDERGNHLIAYLNSLGAGTRTSRFEQIERTSLDSGSAEQSVFDHADPMRGAELFQTFCARCHGSDARGQGAMPQSLAAMQSAYIETNGYELNKPAMNLRKDSLWLVDQDAASDAEQEAALEQSLARLIRFGVPGTSMPGHESLKDQQIADLAAFVLTLPGTDPSTDLKAMGEVAHARIEEPSEALQ